LSNFRESTINENHIIKASKDPQVRLSGYKMLMYGHSNGNCLPVPRPKPKQICIFCFWWQFSRPDNRPEHQFLTFELNLTGRLCTRWGRRRWTSWQSSGGFTISNPSSSSSYKPKSLLLLWLDGHFITGWGLCFLTWVSSLDSGDYNMFYSITGEMYRLLKREVFIICFIELLTYWLSISHSTWFIAV